MNYDVVCIGNAIVDLVSDVTEDFVRENGFDKGGMMLVDAVESARRLALVTDPIRAPGGSAANTAACIASLGGRAAFIGKVGDDGLGRVFREGLAELGVDFVVREAHGEAATANCLAVITPDGERTMSTYLGACAQLSPDDIPEDVIEGARLLFIEGYLLDSPLSAKAVERAIELANRHGVQVAVSLSDANCVRRHFDTFHAIASDPSCRLVIANEKEVSAFRDTDHILDAIDKSRTHEFVSVVTLGKHGCAVVDGHSIDRVPAEPVGHIVDLVGAGDAFAAGFLYAFTRREYLRDCATTGAKCAAVVIQGHGARPHTPLSDAVYGAVDPARLSS